MDIYDYLGKLIDEKVHYKKFFERLIKRMITIEFWKTSFLKRLESMRNFFKTTLEKKKNSSTEFTPKETAHILNKIVSLANIKFTFSVQSKTIVIPLYDPNSPLVSFRDLDIMAQNFLKKEQKEALFKIGYDLNQRMEEVKKNIYQLNHSEKTVLGFVYKNSDVIASKLFKRLQELKIEMMPFDSIEIQIYTFRDLCKYCESFLSLRTSNLFQILLKDFMKLIGQSTEHLRNLTSSNLRITKTASFTIKLPDSSDEEKLCEILKKSKNLCKDYQKKDFFSIAFLIRFLNVQDERILLDERTYFVSCVKDDKEKYMSNYIAKYAINEHSVVSILNALTKRFSLFIYLFLKKNSKEKVRKCSRTKNTS